MFGITEIFEESFTILKDCLRLLQKDPEIILYPFLAGVSVTLVTIGFGFALWDTHYQYVVFGDSAEPWRLLDDPIGQLILFSFYFLNYFAISFFDAALIACVVVRVHGSDPRVSTGLRFAINRWKQLIAWSLFSAFVGVILRLLEVLERKLTRKTPVLVPKLLGFSWSLATVFVVPAIVIERVGPVAAVRKSMAVMFETWGERVVAGVSLAPIKILVFGLSLSPLFVARVIELPTLKWACFGLSVTLFVTTLIVFKAFDSIFNAALYLYATDGRVADGFDEGHLGHAYLETER
jgi:hypothetical protein